MTQLLIAAVLASTAFVQAAPSGEEVALAPIESEAYTFDLVSEGYRNGRMPAERMFSVAGCLLERDAAYTMSLMLEHARQDGIHLVPEWCYRSLGEQQATYQRNCPVQQIEHAVVGPDGTQLTDEQGNPLTTIETRRVCSLPTASPSTSNHGWGRAVDFVVRGRSMSCGDEAFRWLQANGPSYGWVHPYWAHCNMPTAEPWHWEWGGIQVALPVLTLQPGPIVPPEGAE